MMESVLPTLRQELSMYPGPVRGNGSKSWILSDPVSNRFFYISWPSLEILSRWHLGNIDKIVEAVNSETTLTITKDHVAGIVTFLRNNQLIEVRDEQARQRLLAVHAGSQQHLLKWLLKNYLFLRIPLFRPDRFLTFCRPAAAIFFQSWFWKVVICAAILGGFLVFRQWESFVSTFSAFGSWHQLVYFSGAVMVCKVAHELGHAFAANRYGCRIGSMGIALLVLIPVLYTDTNEAWKLSSKKERLIIGAAGILAEIVLAVAALLCWSFLPTGVLKSTAFFISTTAWVISLMLNTSPFMRFDGYFLLSDLTGMVNLHERSFAFGKWFLRKELLGIKLAPPETVGSSTRIWLILFAFAIWVYRLFLFLSIALIVYYLFFKALGIVLLAVEISWFILLPVMREVQQWYGYRKMFTFTWRNSVALLVFIVIMCALCIPIPRKISSPAIWRASEHREVYAPFAARVSTVDVSRGDRVKKGDILMRLEDPDLLNRIEQARLQQERLQWQLDHYSYTNQTLDSREILEQRLAEAVSRVKTNMEEAQQLVVTAPVAGTVSERLDAVRPGMWVADQEALFFIISENRSAVEAFIREEDLRRIRIDAPAQFYPQSMEWGAMECQVTGVDSVNLQELEEPYLASLYGGEIPVRQDAHGRLIPEYTLYRVRQGNCATDVPPSQIVRGRAVFEGKPNSLFMGVLRRAAAVFIRESSF